MPKISALIHSNHDARPLARALETLRCCDEVLVIEHNSQQDTEKVAHEYGTILKPAILGVDDGAYAVDCNHDWIFCLLPNETVSEALEAALLEWKESDPKDVSGYSVNVRQQTGNGWQDLGNEMRLANRKKVNWKERIPPLADNSGKLSGDVLRFGD